MMLSVKMPRPSVFIAIFLLTGLGLIGVANADSDLQRGAILPSGDYLSSDYIAALNSTLSPHHAVNIRNPQLVEITQKDSQTHFVSIIGFHEGAMAFALTKDGHVQVENDYALDTEKLHFKILDTRTFTLQFDKYDTSTYTFVGDVSQYVAEKVLVGDYIDSQGQHYVFRKDGMASFPERRFKYTVGVDDALNPFDYFIDKDANVMYGFKRSGKKLELFKTHGELSQEIDTHPLQSLIEANTNK